MKKILTIPNVISMIRLLLIPAIAVTYLRHEYLWAVAFLLLSGLSDMVDGYIARHFNMVSTLGKILDPIADKLTMVVVVVCLSIIHHPIRMVLAVLIVKEGLMLIGTFLLYKRGKRPCASKIWGKLATVLLYIAVLTVAVSDCAFILVGHGFPPALIWTLSGFACAAMLMALFQYYPLFRAILNGSYDLESEKMKYGNESEEKK